MKQTGQSFFANIPPVVLNLLIINTIFLLATWIFKTQFGIDLYNILGLHFVKSESFYPFQIISYMFMHGNVYHLFFNMFGVYMFGSILEHFWGSKKFLLFYIIAGIGAAIIQQIVWYFQFSDLMNLLPSDIINVIDTNGKIIQQTVQNYLNPFCTVGASGALFGVLFAFGFMFPKEKLMLIFIPIPIPARIFVLLYAVAELFFGVANFSFDNVAHFAHLGGALFGLIMIFWWRHKGKLFTQQI